MIEREQCCTFLIFECIFLCCNINSMAGGDGMPHLVTECYQYHL